MTNELPARFYFALPRLLARLAGRPPFRSEQNGLEAAIAGTLVHAITFIFAVRLLLNSHRTWQQVVLLIPVALVVFVWWPLFTYANTLLIKGARAAGFLRETPDRYVQSVLACTATTLFSLNLLAAGSWMRLLALAWLGAVVLNLGAAAVLALMHDEPAR